MVRFILQKQNPAVLLGHTGHSHARVAAEARPRAGLGSARPWKASADVFKLRFVGHCALLSSSAAIGPPGVQVEALGTSLHVRFLAPRIENEHETWTVKNIYNSWLYNTQYWKNGSDTKVSWAGRWRPALCSVGV